MLGFHSIHAIRRDRCGIPQRLISLQACALGAFAPALAPGSDHCFYLFQLAGSEATGQYKWAVSKQRQRPQTAKRPEGKKSPYGVEVPLGVVLVCDKDIIGNKRWLAVPAARRSCRLLRGRRSARRLPNGQRV